jgi:AcrR family transcriptional regulator
MVSRGIGMLSYRSPVGLDEKFGREWFKPPGATLAERQSDRRQRLIAAGLEEIGTIGYDATTVKSVCARAGLTERYFYEQFSGREALLTEVFEHVVEIVAGAAFAAAQAAPATLQARVRAGLSGFLGALSEDPRRARVQLIEVVGQSPELERRRFEVMHAVAQFIEASATELDPDLDFSPGSQRHAIVLALVGGTNHLAIEWTLGGLQIELADLVDALVALFEAASAAQLPTR